MGGYSVARTLFGYFASDREKPLDARLTAFANCVPALVLSVVYGTVSVVRLATFDDEKKLLCDRLRHQPLNPNAHGILGGILLADPQRLSEATDELRTAVKLQPDLPDGR